MGLFGFLNIYFLNVFFFFFFWGGVFGGMCSIVVVVFLFFLKFMLSPTVFFYSRILISLV